MSASGIANFFRLGKARLQRPGRGRMLQTGALVGGLVLSAVGMSGAALQASAGRAGPARVDEAVVLKPQAARLSAEYGADAQGLRERGARSLTSGRNEATVGAFLRIPDTLRLDDRLERYGAMLDDPRRLALGVAGIEKYAAALHASLLRAGPPQLITVSLAGQRLAAFDRGRLLVDTPVTTGRPSLPTDIGPMQVLEKSAPWTMHSPWPKGSPEWYPDTPVQMVLWFTRNGEGLHDASWQPDSTLGPGSQNGPYASHGCIHVALPAVRTLFDWAPLGTPVVVYPGDGSPMNDQLMQRSVDADGNPVSGVRGI
jgi:lipoprotein-anchoring transpeptidase ErfK/SrfK